MILKPWFNFEAPNDLINLVLHSIQMGLKIYFIFVSSEGLMIIIFGTFFALRITELFKNWVCNCGIIDIQQRQQL